MAARTADLAERCKTVRTLIVDERATESSDRLRRDPRSKLIGQADQPEVREKSWIEPKKEPDKIFCLKISASGAWPSVVGRRGPERI